MRIIFIKDSPGNGRKGELKDVSDGYAKNFLIAKGFAQAATSEIQAKIAKEEKEAKAKRQKELDKMQAVKQDAEKRIFTLAVKVGDKGQIFSGVHDKDVAEVVSKKLGISLERHNVELSKPIKEVGEHKVKIKLGPGIVATVKIVVEAGK